MIILRAFKTELDLNNIQKSACAQHAGAARFAYNWGLERKVAAFHARRKIPSAIDLHRELNALKKTELAWMYKVSKCAPQEALRNLDKAFDHFFQRLRQKQAGKNIKIGFPKFKSKKKGIASFRLTGIIRVFDRFVQLPRLGLLRLKERGYLPPEGIHILSATVSEKAGRWFVSLQVKMDIPNPTSAGKPIAGVDLGVSRMAQVSDGLFFENPRALRNNLMKIKHLQRVLSRRGIGSKNREKATKKLKKIHLHVVNIRTNALHQATTMLAKTKSAIALEDLSVSAMLKNHRLAQAIADVGFYEFRRQLIYKGEWYGCQIYFADRFYPSSKRCSQCGNVRISLSLDERTYHCELCGLVIDRDLNAAINLEHLLCLP